MDWKYHHNCNCSASRGLSSDAKQLAQMMEFSICTEQQLWIIFLANSSFDNCILTSMCIALSILHWNINIFCQEIDSAPTSDINIKTFGGKWWKNMSKRPDVMHISFHRSVTRQVCKETFEPRHDKTNKVSVRPAKTQISLGICPVWSEYLLSTWRNLGSLATH